MNTYYIPIPQRDEDRKKLDLLLAGLSKYYQIEERSFIQLQTECSEMDPIFSKLADHIVRPLPPPEPIKESDSLSQAFTPSGRKGSQQKVFLVEGMDEPVTKTELDALFVDGDVPAGALVTSTVRNRGPWRIHSINGKIELVKQKLQKARA